MALRPPLRTSLLALLLLMSLAFASTLVWAIGSYERFTIDSLKSAKTATLNAAVAEKLSDLFEPNALYLARGLARLAGATTVITRDDELAARAFLENGAKQIHVINHRIKLVDLLLLDSEFHPIAGLTRADERSARLDDFLGGLRQLPAAQREQIASRYMRDEANRPIYVLVHPIGTSKVSGYIVVVASPVGALFGLAAAVGADLVIATTSGEILAEEKFAEPAVAAPDAHYDGLTTRVTARQAMPLDFTLTYDDSSFKRAASEIRRVSYIVSATVVMLTAGFALLTLQFTVFSRISAITRALRRIVTGDTSVVVPEAGRDEIGGMSRDLQRVIFYVRESAKLKESMAVNAELEREVLERRKAEQAAAEAKEQADAANCAKSEFLSNMSHEIRTPMNGILGMNWILLQSELTADQRECAVAIRYSAEALLTVVNDILDVSKLEAGKVTLEIIDFDLVETVDGAVGLLGPKAQEKGIDLSVFIDPSARSGFRGDPTRIRQVLLNIVGNAIKFTERGGVSVEVRSEKAAASHPARICFSVSDTGMGMSEEVRASLFQKFTQADSSITRRFGGTGLGLAISKQLVALMGGEIGVESEAGHGSRIWFTIALPLSTIEVGRSAAPEQLKGLRALIVDDLEVNRRIFTHHLASFGMETATAEDGVQAIAALESAWRRGQPFDLAIIDQLMPGLSGEDVARRIRAMPGMDETKLVLASSAGKDSVSSAGHIDAVLTKPVREQTLLDALTRLFSFSVPAPEQRVPAPKEPPAAPATSAPATASTRPLRILVAEDNRINRKIVGILLEHAGHQVAMAVDGEQAVAAVRDGDYDVVLMDVQMPILDGMQATKQIRALPAPKSSLPIIALTAHAMEGAKEEYLAAGMDGYLSKPLDPVTLAAKLAEVTRNLSDSDRAPERRRG